MNILFTSPPSSRVGRFSTFSLRHACIFALLSNVQKDFDFVPKYSFRSPSMFIFKQNNIGQQSRNKNSKDTPNPCLKFSLLSRLKWVFLQKTLFGHLFFAFEFIKLLF